MEKRFILCSECGAKNRLGEGEGTPKCGKCGKTLNVPRPSDLQKFVLSPLGLLAGGALAIFILIAILDDDSKPYSKYARPTEYAPPASDTLEVQEPEFNEPPVSITPGIVHEPKSEAVAPLAIQTSHGSNYYAKLVNLDTGVETMSMYIIGGIPFETLVPLGRYELRYAAGDIWYGQTHRFGPDTVYSKANSVFEFTQDYEGYRGYTVELILQRNGNLKTQRINPTNF